MQKYCDIDLFDDQLSDFSFKDDLKLEEIEIPTGVRVIKSGLFEGCKNLKKVIIPEGVEVIEKYAFYNCENLSEVVLPSSLKVIKQSAFEGCRFNIINLNEGLEKIESRAFASCYGKADKLEIVLPKSVKVVENYAFEGSWVDILVHNKADTNLWGENWCCFSKNPKVEQENKEDGYLTVKKYG